MPFSSQSVFYVLILNRTKGKVEGEIRSYLFSSFTIRDITEKKINHHRQYHTDQKKHLTAPSGFTLEYLKAFFHATENHWHPPGFPSGCSTSSSTNRGWRVRALPEETEQRWTQLLPPHTSTLLYWERKVFFNRVHFKCHASLLLGACVFSILQAPARWGASLPAQLFGSLWMGTFPYCSRI